MYEHDTYKKILLHIFTLKKMLQTATQSISLDNKYT